MDSPSRYYVILLYIVILNGGKGVFPWRIFYLIPEHGMCVSPFSIPFSAIFPISACIGRLFPSNSEEFLYQDSRSDIAHDISTRR